MTLQTHWVNGIADADIPVNDRGFSFGDSLFETLRIHRGKAHLWPRHEARLQRGLDRLGIDCPRQRIADQLQQGLDWLERSGHEDAAARLTVSRGPAERGYRGQAGSATIALQLHDVTPWRTSPQAVPVTVCKTRLANQPLLAGIKHGNRLEQVLAGRELDVLGQQDGLLCNMRGELVCALSANIFIVSGRCLLTPPIEECGVAGTVRELILDDLAAAAGMPVEVTCLRPADLARADELFLTNSLQGIRSVSGCDGHSFTSTRWGDNLREHFYRACESST